MSSATAGFGGPAAQPGTTQPGTTQPGAAPPAHRWYKHLYVQVLAAILAAEAGVPADEAWRALLGGGQQLALLLRLADVPRREAAPLLANASPGLGIGDPVSAIEAFDHLSDAHVEAIRAELILPPAYRRAKAILARHG